MRKLFRFFMVLAVSALPSALSAEELIPARRAIVSSDADLPGGDFSSVFDTTSDACERACIANKSCEAYTFNSRNNSCFLKQGPGEESFFQGAISARIVSAPPAAAGLASSRRAELDFLPPHLFSEALDMASSLGRTHTSGSWSAEEHLQSAADSEAQGDMIMATAFTGAALNVEDRPDLWLEYARRASQTADRDENNRYWYRQRALLAAINGYLRSEHPAQRHSLLVQMALDLEQQGMGREMVPALRLAQDLQQRSDTAQLLETAMGKYGFRIEDHVVEADLARPRICARFTEDLVATGVDYSDYIKLPGAGLAVEMPDQRQLCLTGVQHGERYSLTFRQGLPAADGQSLAKDIELSMYIRDRAAAVRFPGRGYVLPKTGDAALPVESVNIDTIELELYQVTDRNMLRSIQEYYFGTPMAYYQEYDFRADIGTSVWKGEARLLREVNRDVTTRLPLGEALQGKEAGIYALRAAIPGSDSYDTAPAWQWFVISDLGVTTLSGVDGLHVFVRSLASAGAKAGVTAELLSRANAVLGTTTTDDQGYARFDAGLARGTGAQAPAMIVLRDGDSDISFLSLTDPEFDLSDRGVEGREPAPPVDVFLTTDRGAYRAGETVYATAVARNPVAEAVEGLPLTAVLTRPDGVEYSRQLVEDKGAGGYVFELSVAGSAPRGVWSLAILADAKGEALTRKTFLVEDFLPERIDFTLKTEGETLSLSEPVAALTLDAKYLFGAPAAGLAVEGEVLLRAAPGLTAFPGYVFGRHDQPFETLSEGLGGAETLEDGKAYIDAALPVAENVDRPLQADFVLRVSEGSGRPVERRLSVPVTPDGPMIGVKPGFDGVVAEGSEARFSLIALGPDLAPQPMEVKWTLTRLQTDWQWYQSYGSWNWEPVTYRSVVAEGAASLGGDPAEISAKVDWGQYELKVEEIGGSKVVSSTGFYSGWYAPADVSATPDTLELSLDRPDYKAGDQAQLRIVPRAAGTALVTVVSNRLVGMKAVEVSEGENLIALDVTDDWGAGVYVTASVLRPMDVAAGRVPSRALGLSYAKIDPGKRALQATVEAADAVDPRGALDVAVKVEGIEPGETGYVTIAAVDQGILNLTAFKSPDPQGHFFGQRKLGVGIRDIYGRLIDGLNGAEGEVRSGGDAGAQARLQAPPPTEELVAYFSGPLEVGADGYARTSFTLPSFNGSVKVMAVAWSKTGVGQADKEVLVRDPVVVTASLPRFMAPGDASRLLLELVHASGPSGKMSVTAAAEGVTLGAFPADVTLAEHGKQVIEVPVTALLPGIHKITVTLTTPEGKALVKELTLPVQANDPEVAKISRLDLKSGESFTFDQAVFADLQPGSGKSVMTIGPLARLNAPGLLVALDHYPYGCTEQMTSRALPLIYFDEMARLLDLKGADNIRGRVEQAVAEILTRQASSGSFGLWSTGSGDLWLDSYVTDFLSRAKAQGYAVPDLAFRNALSNLRNQVNYAPEFDAKTEGGGTALAYALMVLAREGAAAIGDLRYYADVKGDDFATPLAQGQLAAALASYGDQTRADQLFRKAGTRMQERFAAESGKESYWRADYGTNSRDAAALLTLAVESGSQAIDREALTDRLVSRGSNLSTQEATWMLMASNALIDRPDTSGITLNGAAAEGPLVRILQDGAEPVVVKNEGADTILTLSTYGIPAEAEPAGGNGFTLERAYYTLEGEPASAESVKSGDRLVVVLTVTPWDQASARLLLADPLPAGFEIDNPNLISGGSTSGLGWLNDLPGEDISNRANHAEFRQERFMTQVDWTSRNAFRASYIVRAISPGQFHHPAASVEDMYRPDFRARTGIGQVTVTAE
ncbi:alpha-2-macroglobulin family protein [Pseudogemmobacter faecipullorum]|uniref:Alpha-2-macroglobulin family protein n=1 Tax=Pseudogemmobacter faecipullorum TaxID=2755041 RepID=A0ABS8CNR6_9RHOB|nr:alpha-2-macroglobulin family protein [Pseudogemmobacter faecipullorum]MCB5411037.1 alpha-2-macroglobulin family protein [Pseudogemmobacter faecipullorum]